MENATDVRFDAYMYVIFGHIHSLGFNLTSRTKFNFKSVLFTGVKVHNQKSFLCDLCDRLK